MTVDGEDVKMGMLEKREPKSMRLDRIVSRTESLAILADGMETTKAETLRFKRE